MNHPLPVPVPKVVLATHRGQEAPAPSDRLLLEELAKLGVSAQARPWDDISPLSLAGCVVCLRSTWDYHHRVAEFRRWISALAAAKACLWNRPATVLWNMDKVYLRELAAAGVPVPRSRWLEPGEVPDVERFRREEGLHEVVVKPRIGATAHGLLRRTRGSGLSAAEAAALIAHGSVVQEYLPEVEERGEVSLVYLAGGFSHAVRKMPASGEFRVQSEFGGRVAPLEADERERRFGLEVLARVALPWLYARVDLVESFAGRLVLMELELIEPDLFLDFAPSAASRFARELVSCGGRR